MVVWRASPSDPKRVGSTQVFGGLTSEGSVGGGIDEEDEREKGKEKKEKREQRVCRGSI